MGDHPKYIIIEQEGLEQAIVFPAILDHSFIGANKKVVSAGFCCIGSYDGNPVVSAWGQSVTLKLSFRQQDAKIIEKSLNLGD